MRKKAITISIVAGIFVLGIYVKSAVGSRDIPVIENAAVVENIVSDESDGQTGQETAAPDAEQQDKAALEPEQQDKTVVPIEVDFAKPIVKLYGEEGELSYNWDYNSIRLDADTLLLISECYFPEEKIQQKIFFMAKAPYFVPQEVFRQDDKAWDKEPDPQEWMEQRMKRPHSVDGGYIYEVDGILYFLDKNFKKASPLWDLRQLMGDFYSFSPATSRTCDVTADASRLLACTDEGLYEYDLENGERKLLEPAFFVRLENAYADVLAEGDCLCGVRDFEFSGPVKAEYAPDGQSYAFLTGTEEADWGDITGAVLRSKEGETLYQKDTGYMYDFKWVESEDSTYLAVFYMEDDGETRNWKMDRVDVNTGEMMTFEVPKEVFWGAAGCCVVGFLDADSLFYFNYDKQDDQNVFEVYRLSSGQRQNLEVAGEADWEMIVLDEDGYDTWPVRYPK